MLGLWLVKIQGDFAGVSWWTFRSVFLNGVGIVECVELI